MFNTKASQQRAQRLHTYTRAKRENQFFHAIKNIVFRGENTRKDTREHRGLAGSVAGVKNNALYYFCILALRVVLT